MTNQLIVYCDGGSLGNPGRAAVGVVIKNAQEKIIKKYSKEIGIKTNNQAEYEAVIFALKKIKQLFGKDAIGKMEIHILTDSELIVNQLNGKYKIKEKDLIPLFIEIWNLKTDFGKVFFKQVPREKTEEAHRALSEALSSKNASLF